MSKYRDVEFQECPQCAAKTGSPTLCPSCLHNRHMIHKMKLDNARLYAMLDGLGDVVAGIGRMIRNKPDGS